MILLNKQQILLMHTMLILENKTQQCASNWILKHLLREYAVLWYGLWENLLIGANTTSNICKNIPNKIVAYQFYKDNFADRISVVITLISFSLLVWFGDYVGSVIKWNLLLIFLIIQVRYIMIRMYLRTRSF